MCREWSHIITTENRELVTCKLPQFMIYICFSMCGCSSIVLNNLCTVLLHVQLCTACDNDNTFLQTNTQSLSGVTHYGHNITLHFITLHYITLHYITLHFISLHYITLHYITFHYITLHYITFHYITLHYISLHYITLHYITFHLADVGRSRTEQPKGHGPISGVKVHRSWTTHKAIPQVAWHRKWVFYSPPHLRWLRQRFPSDTLRTYKHRITFLSPLLMHHLVWSIYTGSTLSLTFRPNLEGGLMSQTHGNSTAMRNNEYN